MFDPELLSHRKPSAILGVGRSGTTLVLSVLQKIKGVFTLFEPFAPLQNRNRDYRFEENITPALYEKIIKHSIEKIRDSYWYRRHDSQWQANVQEKVFRRLIFKEIRLNFKIDQIITETEKIIVVDRDILPIFLSQMARPTFYNDLGGIEIYWSKYISQQEKASEIYEHCFTKWRYSKSSLKALIMLIDEQKKLNFFTDKYQEKIMRVQYDELIDEVNWQKICSFLNEEIESVTDQIFVPSTTTTLNPSNLWLSGQKIDREYLSETIQGISQSF